MFTDLQNYINANTDVNAPIKFEEFKTRALIFDSIDLSYNGNGNNKKFNIPWMHSVSDLYFNKWFDETMIIYLNIIKDYFDSTNYTFVWGIATNVCYFYLGENTPIAI